MTPSTEVALFPEKSVSWENQTECSTPLSTNNKVEWDEPTWFIDPNAEEDI